MSRLISSVKLVSLHRDEESIESYYSRFNKMMNEMVRNKLETIDLDKKSYHKLFDILKQYQNKVNEIRAEKLARNANTLALVANAQHYPEDHNQAPKPHKSITPSSRQPITSKSHSFTRHKGKEIAKPITPLFESTSEEDNGPKQTQREKQLQNNLALVAKFIKKIYSKPNNNNLRTSSNTRNKNMDTTSRSGNDKNTRQFLNQKTVTVIGARETVRNQAEKGVPLSAYQGDWLDDTDEELNEQELEAHCLYMTKIQEVSTTESGPTFDAEPLEKVHTDNEYNVFDNDQEHTDQPKNMNDTPLMEMIDSNTTPDSLDVCDNDFKDDQNANDQEDERCKSALAESNDIRDRCRSALYNQEIELEKYKKYKDSQIEKEELERKLKASLDRLA
ncbi:hypothetical protein Tco_1503692 [Tanacetum coccineum]